jgi:hypothetical protein
MATTTSLALLPRTQFQFRRPHGRIAESVFFNPENPNSTYQGLQTRIDKDLPTPPAVYPRAVATYHVSNHRLIRYSLAYLIALAATLPPGEDLIVVLASAAGICLKTSDNMLRSATPTIELNVAHIVNDTVQFRMDADVIQSDAPFAAPPLQSVNSLLEATDIEMAALIGMWYHGACKGASEVNRDAFNRNRRGAIRSLVGEDLVLFVDNTPLLHTNKLNELSAAINVFPKMRACLFSKIVDLLSQDLEGVSTAFGLTFSYNRGHGFTPLDTVRFALSKHKDFVEYFPELHHELRLLQDAEYLLASGDIAMDHYRPYLKAIFGREFIPFGAKNVACITEVAARISRLYHRTMRNFNTGANLTERQVRILDLLITEYSGSAIHESDDEDDGNGDGQA